MHSRSATLPSDGGPSRLLAVSLLERPSMAQSVMAQSVMATPCNLLALAFLPFLAHLVAPGSLLAGASVVINEVHYHPGDDSRTGEFIELFNHGVEDADLSGWMIAGGVTFHFPTGTQLPARSYLVVAADPQGLRTHYEAPLGTVMGPYEGSLSNREERVDLWTSDVYLMSYVTYSDTDPWPESADGLGPSLERISPLREEADAEAWAASIPVGGTPGAPNSVRIEDPSAPGSTTTFVPRGATWRFFRGRAEPPAAWAEAGFDDGAWESGPAGFGYDDGDDATLLTDMRGNYTTLYIRRSFQLADASAVESLTLSVLSDDGCVAYLNGVEVYRFNAGSAVGTPLPHDAVASARVDLATWRDVDLAGRVELLVNGINVLAVQGLNGALDNPDFSLDASLSGELRAGGDPPLPEPPPARPPRDVVINEVEPTALTGWVELFNVTSSAVPLDGMRLEVFPRTRGSYLFPAATTIPPRGRIVIDQSALGYDLAAAASVILVDARGHWIDGIDPRTLPPGHSTGRWPDGCEDRYVFPIPTRNAENRILLEDRIVINEIQYHPEEGNAGGEFVELHNRSGTEAVDVSGWSFTRGVEYTIPPGTTIPPQGFLVIAQDPDAAAAAYGVPRPLGPYAGGLNNDAETLLLRDALRNPVDRVRYADEGSWPPEADGDGPSLELIHPLLENRYGPAWAASEGVGTPGARNSRFAADPNPVVAGVSHSPVVPAPDVPVLVTARISDDQPIPSATLFWRDDGTGATFQAAMVDDGLGDDGIASNGIWGATIPPQPDRTIVLFWIRADAAGGQSATVPAGAPTPAFLYQVETFGPKQVRPIYRIIMRAADLNTLRTRSTSSNVLLDCTFVAGERAYYNRGIRLRGQSARNCTPRSYRVQFTHDVDFLGFQDLNLNGCDAHRQWIGLDFLSRTGIPTPQCWFRKLSFNGAIDAALHLRVEATDEDFLKRVLPGDDTGNLYRGEHQADLSYRGGSFGSYLSYYLKQTNEAEADWSDIVDLCYRFDDATTRDADFPEAIEAAIDIHEWALYFAAWAVLGSTENAIQLDGGDDYFIYRVPSTGKWIILPWDCDSVFNQANQALFRPTVDQIERFLEHPRYAPLYWCYLEILVDGAFRPDLVKSRIDHLAPLFDATVVGQLRQFSVARHGYIASRLSRALTVSVPAGGGICGSTIRASSGTLSLAGLAPGCGTTEVFVESVRASYDPQTNRWTSALPIDRSGPLSIRAIDREGFVVEARSLTVETSDAYRNLPATIGGPASLTAADSPYLISGTVTVEAGASLAVEPGVAIVLDAGARLVVRGRLVALGTAESPVRFLPHPCATGSEGIVIEAGSVESRISHAVFSGRFQAGGRRGGIVLAGADLVLDHVRYRGEGASGGEGGGVGVEVLGGGRLVLEDSRIEDVGTGVLVDAARAEIRRSEIRGAGTAAVRLISGATALLERCVLREAAVAVAVTGGSSASLEHLTIHAVGAGIDAREVEAGAGPGTVEAHSLIVWDAGAAALEDAVADVAIVWSDLSGGVRPGEGNISADPLFLSPAAGDFRLVYFSPCRSAGRDGMDMGAIPYESLGETGTFLRCDSNVDGGNDLADAVFTLLALFNGGSELPCPPAADCNGDARIDLADAVFNLNYLFLSGMPPPEPYPGCETVFVEECPGRFCGEI